MGEASVFRFDVDGVFNAGELAELCFYDNAAVVRVFDDLFGDLDVFFKGMMGSVDHDGSEPVRDGSLAGFKIGAVVEVHDDGQTGRFDGSGDEVSQIHGVSVFSCTRGNLQDERGIAFFARFHDPLNGLHVVDVERAHGIAARVRFFEHFGRCYQRHI